MINSILFKTRFKIIIDAFWLREDILETIPNCRCEYLDNSFKLLYVASETLFSENDLKWLFELYKMEFSIIEQSISKLKISYVTAG
ncbi:hypothetical protein QE441_002972 [Chryseobacterium sp. SORGH_AS909]|uniref:Uncharacterized protein n=1 Tax=Chryseobacterium camelliae TaxID=1265445 RepID=A0ABU0TFQ6_9FLAO|nr:hypothetical protein [Chryseobacterium camelliae]MDQ1099832.1 hypothetical protein [Chryseobacterium sp. SORGH_AS_1048]MDR6087178.1 hypothetical protein [Chryseobacterium sp. SORGH_AS_0909]MDR6131552.1 hypothetical protein [Chryseobacterium sp. SORGH_AS_1175]MDT3406306.1 hypothetical protein [Pseudacidovorax intermedius]